MILSVKISPQMAVSCPHTRGDDPYMSLRLSGTIYLSPYAWGWSYADYIHNKYTRLVPIRVGMILCFALPSPSVMTCPHTRGDDPEYEKCFVWKWYLSPYAWGWSYLPLHIPSLEILVPIRVGMILKFWIRTLQILACPHTRGDDPT